MVERDTFISFATCAIDRLPSFIMPSASAACSAGATHEMGCYGPSSLLNSVSQPLRFKRELKLRPRRA
jgi:hypothetical protein